MNWLERASREIGGFAVQRTANTAERTPTAVMAVLPPPAVAEPPASISSNGSAQPWQMEESEALREAFEERAAIMEYDGGLPREEAEREASALISKYRVH